MEFRRFSLFVVFSISFFVTSFLPGCRPPEDTPPPPGERKSDPGEEPVEPETPEVDQSEIDAAIATIEAAAGKITRDESGVVTGVDLASDRVSADDETVDAVLKLSNLKVLRLACSGVSSDRILALKQFNQLEELLLQDTTITDEELSDLLSETVQLQRLTLRRLFRVTDDCLDSIVGLPELEILALIEMNVTSTGIQQAATIPRLRSLDLRNCGSLTADELADLPSFETLAELKLGGSTIDDAVMDILIEMPALKSLSIEDAQITEVGIQTLAENVDLAARMRSLTFARSFGVSDEALASIGTMQSLETLALKDCYVTGSFVGALSEAVDGEPLPLKTLVMTGSFLNDEAMAALPAFAPTLVRLDMTRSAIMTSGMAQIGRLTELQTLTLSECGLNDEGLAEIATLSKLTTLNISKNFEISNASTAVIEGLPALQNVISTETGISP